MAKRFASVCALGLLLWGASAAVARRAQAICAYPQSCVCETLPTEYVLRGRVASMDGARAAVDVREVLVNRTQFDVKPGSTIAGNIDDAQFCDIPETRFAPGDEVLALWRGPTHDALLECDAYANCSYEQCGAPDANGTFDKACHQTCLEANTDACTAVIDRSQLVLIAWKDELDLGEGRRLASSEAALLGDHDSCVTRYPAPPPLPCDDVIRTPIHEGCGIAGSQTAGGAFWCALLLLWAARRRMFQRA